MAKVWQRRRPTPGRPRSGPFAERSRRDFAGYTATELMIVSRFLERDVELTQEQLERIRADGSSPAGRELLP
jgi:hypothetical protein